jgi:hypothetical protein
MFTNLPIFIYNDSLPQFLAGFLEKMKSNLNFCNKMPPMTGKEGK